MCTLVALRRPFPGIDLVVAAARDERWDRPSEPLGRLSGEPRVWGGRDLESGGTWLTVDRRGVVVAVTNAGLGVRTREGQRSRGLLALDVATAGDPEASEALLRAEDLSRYAAVNVLIASGERMVVACNRPERRIVEVAGRAIGLGNEPVLVPDPRVAAATALLRPAPGEGVDGWRGRAEEVLARHTFPAVCRHGERGGTVWAAVVVVPDDGTGPLVREATGPPCSNRFVEVEVI